MDEGWRGSQAASRCPLLSSDIDLNTIISHNALFCDRCRDEQILEKTKGEEILFANSPPYWILPSNSSDFRGDQSFIRFICYHNGNEISEEDQLQKTYKTDFPESVSSKGFIGTKQRLNAGCSSSVQDEKLENIGKPRKRRKEEETSKKLAPRNKSVKFARQDSEKREAKVPTNIALHKLAKQGYSKEEALQKYVEKQRERAHPKSEDDKVQIDRENMPWAPPFPKILRKYHSVIQKSIDHQRYVAIVANFLNANHSQPRFQQNRQEIMDEKLKDERMEYQKLVLQSLCSRKKSVYNCGNRRAISYILDRLRSRAASLHCQYSAPIYDEEMKDLTVDALTVLTKKTILYRGKVPKITLPNERRRFVFNRMVEDISLQYPPNEKTVYPLESDEFAVHLAVKYGVRVIMCSSSALKILCNPWIADSTTYLMPVVVKRSFSERTNRFENVCLVGKPCIEKAINGPSLWKRYMKFSLKLAIYGDLKKETDEKIPARTGGRQRTCFRRMERTNDKNQMGEEPDNDSNLIIADEAAENEESFGNTSDTITRKEINNIQNIHNDVPSSSSPPVLAPVCGDILGDIMNEMGTSDNDFTKNYEGMDQNSAPSTFIGADPNKRYTLFSLGHDGMQDVDLIIRANNDGIDAMGNELSIVHKIEYAAEFGAERLDDEEWLHDYFRCKLKCASQLVRLRIHYLEQHLLQRERYNENMLTANRPDLRKLAEERTQWLKKIVVKLESLQPGNYLIRKEANKLQILLPTADVNNAYLTEDHLKQLYFDEHLPPVEEVFRGIDEHLVLVYHIVQKRIPASFGAKKDGVTARNPRKNASAYNNDQEAHRQQSKIADDVFGDLLKEGTAAHEGASSNHQLKRHEERNRPRGNFRGNSRMTQNIGKKRPRFTDLDAPDGQAL
uniref:Little elongation complex subunit 2 C-terminal domain-containing protein n=1 Tax=Setaria digitata TaxID=48799 RepID=A0A915Q6D2_9BILA